MVQNLRKVYDPNCDFRSDSKQNSMMWMDGKVFLRQKWQKSRSRKTKMQKKIVYCAYLLENGSICNTEIIFGRF